MGDGQHPRVLVVLDGTEEADVTAAPLRATRPGAQDLVLFALLPSKCTDQVLDRTRRQCADAARCLAIPGRSVESDVRRGEPAPEIVAAARIHAVDVIAMRLHSRSRLERCFFDEVADEVVRQAAVPVLLLPPGERHLTPRGMERTLRRVLAVWR